MSCLGVHFALTPEEIVKLRSFENDADRLAFLQEEIEENYFQDLHEYVAETDKSWDAMHRLLSDGELSDTDGPEPLRFAVLGGEPLYFKDDYIMSLKTPEQVKAVSEAIATMGADEFRIRYNKIDEEKYGFPRTDEDFEYTWDWFGRVVELYKKAADENRYVLFTADQ